MNIKHAHKLIIYEIAEEGENRELDWYGAFNKGLTELSGLDIISESHNGCDVYYVRKKSCKPT